MPRLLDRINFSKIVVILASTFGIALGACGLTFLASRTSAGNVVVDLGVLELAVMILSGVGLALTVIVWVVVSIIRRGASPDSEPQRLFDSSSDDEEKKS